MERGGQGPPAEAPGPPSGRSDAGAGPAPARQRAGEAEPPKYDHYRSSRPSKGVANTFVWGPAMRPGDEPPKIPFAEDPPRGGFRWLAYT